MTETHATPVTEPPIFPAGRYGRRRAPRRRSRLGFALVMAAAVALSAGVTVQLYGKYGQPEYSPRVTRFSEITDGGITVDFEVHKPADVTATCRVRARAADGDEVGLAEVEVGRGDRVEVTYRLLTSRKPVTVEVPGCGPARTE